MVIRVNLQKGIIMYQFLLSPRNAVQIFKPAINPEISLYKTPTCWLGSILLFLRETQTDVLVKDGVEMWVCVAWTVVIVWVRSVSVRILRGNGKYQEKTMQISKCSASWMPMEWSVLEHETLLRRTVWDIAGRMLSNYVTAAMGSVSPQ
jgi:hypothetical protein